MIKKTAFIFILLVITSCTEKNEKTEQIINYYEGFKNSDYNQIKRTISDSLTIIEGDYTMAFTPKSYHEQFKWDSVFKPVYKVISLENQNTMIIATVSVNSLKFEFLENNPLTCRHKFYFSSEKISKIENIDCIDADWKIWQSKRDSLVDWIKFNHPKLDGFIHDLSMKGAIHYLNAIELYENRETKAMN